jgi:uncharacterized alkaline shock family protein YloU
VNILNRVLAIVLALLVLAAAVLVLIVGVGLVSPQQIGIPLLADVLAPFAELEPPELWWLIGAAALLMVLALILLVAELTPPERDHKLTVKEDELGRVTVSQSSLRKLANREAGQVPGVLESDSELDESRQGLEVRSRVSVDPSSDVPQLADQVRERVKAALERHLGREVKEVTVSAQLEPLSGKKQRRVR